MTSYEIDLISIHAAREGGDPLKYFGCKTGVISIHAAREGGDYRHSSRPQCRNYFNPRRP